MNTATIPHYTRLSSPGQLSRRIYPLVNLFESFVPPLLAVAILFFTAWQCFR
jgi:hypothetical protein